MKTANINEVMKTFTDNLGVNEVEFEYKSDKFVSTNTIILDEFEPIEYLIVVKVLNDTGTVVLGYADGIKFVETKTLGQILFENDSWTVL